MPTPDQQAAMDFAAPFLTMPQLPSVAATLVLPPVAPVPNFLDSINALAKNITGAASAYYGTQAQLEAAKAAAAIAKAQGQNSVQVAQTGAPSMNALLLGGGALLALFLVLDKSK